MFFRNVPAAERSALSLGNKINNLLPKEFAATYHYHSESARLRLVFPHIVLQHAFQDLYLFAELTLLAGGQVYFDSSNFGTLGGICAAADERCKHDILKSLHVFTAQACKDYINVALENKLDHLDILVTVKDLIIRYHGQAELEEIEDFLQVQPRMANTIPKQIKFLLEFEKIKTEVLAKYHQEKLPEYLAYIERLKDPRRRPHPVALQLLVMQIPEAKEEEQKSGGQGQYTPSLAHFIKVSNDSPLLSPNPTLQEQERIKQLENANPLLCCGISLGFCHTPVRVEGVIYDLKELEMMQDFQRSDKFSHPVTRVKVAKSQIQMAPDVREATQQLVAPRVEINDDIRKKMFIRIYAALKAGQSGYWKTDWVTRYNIVNMNTASAIALIQEHAKKPGSRTQKAWELVMQHSPQDIPDNVFLIKKIYAAAFEKSGLLRLSRFAGGLFWRMSALQKQLEQVRDLLPSTDKLRSDSRLNKIISTLNM
jgi:hypothetical protein